jgi:hypothetical protein
METIKLSIEELIFSFYSEGFFEQGMSIKEMYFPEMKDEELKILLEFASRSLLAKDLVTEVNNRYKVKEDYISFIKIMNHAERTVKASKFSTDLKNEETISVHMSGDEVYLHKLLYDNQIHQISKISSKEDTMELVKEFFSFKDLTIAHNEVLFSMKRTEFEELLETVSQGLPSQSFMEGFTGNEIIKELINDLIYRKARMDSLLYMEYDEENTPDLLDVCFVIPGKAQSWLVTRNQTDEYNFEKCNENTLGQFIFKNKVITL